MNCPACKEAMNKHRTLDLWWCVNPRCRLFDRPLHQRAGLGGRSEEPEHLPGLPSAPKDAGE